MRRVLSVVASTVLVGAGVALPSEARTLPSAQAGPTCTIMGTAGDDVLTGTSTRDVICALEGNDNVHGLGGNDLLVGGPGDDQQFGGSGRDVLRGEGGFDFLQGDGGDDTLYGGASGDTFNATRGNTVGVVADGSDLMFGGPDSDTASYLRRLVPLSVTLDGVANDGAAGENDQALVENVNGGDGDDDLVGTEGPNFLVSRGGADTITGLGGDDVIDVQDNVGDDVVDAGDGEDYCAADPNRRPPDLLTSCETVY